jgi:restriction endonuclease Mrr
MEENYSKSIIDCAIEKLTSAKKPLTELELTKGIVHLLKVKLGKDNPRHSSKGRFRRDSFKYIIGTTDWKESIAQLENKKFVLSQDYEIKSEELNTDAEWHWIDVSKTLAQKNILSILHKIDPTRFEYLVRDVVKKTFPDVSFEVTVSTGDMGIDIFGVRNDPCHKDKKEAICIQVKRFKGTVSRPDADKFIGAVSRLINDNTNNFSKFEGYFISTGKFPKSFNEQLYASNKTGVTFASWDGEELSHRILSLGFGVKYSIDIDFWNDIDPTVVPRKKK